VAHGLVALDIGEGRPAAVLVHQEAATDTIA